MNERLAFLPWMEHYEVVVCRYGRDHVVARAATRRDAELAVYSMSRRVEISRSAMSLRRTRGVHPANAAKACILLIVVALLLPWFWPKVVLSIVCTALMFGLLSSGSAWRQGGDDDR